MNQSVRCYDLPAIGIEQATVKSRQPALRLLYQQTGGRQIPRVQPLLPESVESTSGHVAQIQRRRSESSYRAGTREEPTEKFDHFICFLMNVVGESSAEHGIQHHRRPRDPYRHAVQPSTNTAFSRKQFATSRVEHRPDFRNPVDLKRQTRAVDRQPVDIIYGSINRVKHPAVTVSSA